MFLENPQGMGIRIVEDLFGRIGRKLSAEDIDFLNTRERRLEELSPTHETHLKEIVLCARRGFYEAATDGVEFVDRETLFECFGDTVESNYPEGGPAFIRFARSYWTLKIMADALREVDPYRLLTPVLDAIEREVGPVFFPAPGHFQIDSAQREREQRKILGEFAPRMDVDQFIDHNPTLRRDGIHKPGFGRAVGRLFRGGGG